MMMIPLLFVPLPANLSLRASSDVIFYQEKKPILISLTASPNRRLLPSLWMLTDTADYPVAQRCQNHCL